MNGFRFIKGVAVSLATLGAAFPQIQVVAAESPQSNVRPAAKSTQSAGLADIALTAGGTFTGRIVDHTGKAIEGAEVVLRQNQKVVARTVSDAKGMYTFTNLKGGIYQASSGNTEGQFRVWAEQKAPPKAKEHALLVMGENGARGQFGAVDPTLVLLTGATIASVVISGVNLSRTNKIEDRLKKIPTSP